MKGPELLQKYLTEHNLTCFRFSLMHRLDPGNVRLLLRGQRMKVSVDLAHAIEKATLGAVPWHAWLREEKEQEHGETKDQQTKQE